MSKNSYKVGIIMPQFCDQRYLRDRDENIYAENEQKAIDEYTNKICKTFLNEDEIVALKRGKMKIGIIKDE